VDARKGVNPVALVDASRPGVNPRLVSLRARRASKPTLAVNPARVLAASGLVRPAARQAANWKVARLTAHLPAKRPARATERLREPTSRSLGVTVRQRANKRVRKPVRVLRRARRRVRQRANGIVSLTVNWNSRLGSRRLLVLVSSDASTLVKIPSKESLNSPGGKRLLQSTEGSRRGSLTANFLVNRPALVDVRPLVRQTPVAKCWCKADVLCLVSRMVVN